MPNRSRLSRVAGFQINLNIIIIRAVSSRVAGGYCADEVQVFKGYRAYVEITSVYRVKWLGPRD